MTLALLTPERLEAVQDEMLWEGMATAREVWSEFVSASDTLNRNLASKDEVEGRAVERIFPRLRWDPLLLESGPYHCQEGSEVCFRKNMVSISIVCG